MPNKLIIPLRFAMLVLALCAAGAGAQAQDVTCYCESAVFVDPYSGEYTAYTSMEWDVPDPEYWFGSLSGTFTNAADQSEEGDGLVADELDWAGDVTLGTTYEIDGDAVLYFLYDICNCYYEVFGPDSYSVPSAPTISLQNLYLVSPPTVEATWSVSNPVLVGCYVTFNTPDGQTGDLTYLDNCTTPVFEFDETTTWPGFNQFTFTGQMYGWNVYGDTFSITRTDGTPNTQGNAAAFLISGSGQCAEFTGQCAAIFATYVLSYSAVEFYSTFQAGPGSYNSTSYSTGGAGGSQIIVPQTPPDPLFAVSGTNTLDNSWYGSMAQQATLPADAVSVMNTWLIPLEGTGDSGVIFVQLLIDGGDGLAYSQDSLTLTLP